MNQIKRITREEYITLVEKRQGKDMVVQVDGAFCKNLKDYFRFIYQRLNFPADTIRPSYNGYDDWMTDGTYFNNDKIHLIILNYDMFISEDIEAKQIIMDHFETHILPWWEHDVVNCVVGGKTKEFNVYIVE